MRAFLRTAKRYAAAFFAGLAAGLVALLAILTGGIDLKEEQRRERADVEKRLSGQEQEAVDDREARAEQADEIRRRIQAGTLCILLGAALLTGAARVRAAVSQTQPPASSCPAVPADYDTLKHYYLTVWDLSEKWRGLYLEAEESARKLRESNERLLAVIAEQEKEIQALRARRPSLGLFGGAAWSPSGPGVYVGGGVSW